MTAHPARTNFRFAKTKSDNYTGPEDPSVGVQFPRSTEGAQWRDSGGCWPAQRWCAGGLKGPGIGENENDKKTETLGLLIRVRTPGSSISTHTLTWKLSQWLLEVALSDEGFKPLHCFDPTHGNWKGWQGRVTQHPKPFLQNCSKKG